MIFVEFVLLILALIIIYRLFGPIQKKIESTLLTIFKKRNPKSSHIEVINITSYTSEKTSEKKDKGQFK